MHRRPSGVAVRRLLRGIPVMGNSEMGVSSTNRVCVTSSSFPSLDFHVSLEGWLAPAVGLVPVEGLASAEGLASVVRLDSLVSHDVSSASEHLG